MWGNGIHGPEAEVSGTNNNPQGVIMSKSSKTRTLDTTGKAAKSKVSRRTLLKTGTAGAAAALAAPHIRNAEAATLNLRMLM
jgi:hypothetical protein